ncbi:helix-turn-helix domain-containing protein [Ureibacillus chungkukjangi]|uniref:Helix-turn-helix protein n=2 Tax=Ureibacillus chungkukjangi TaxID=1202712 RepID=A0A318T9X8_9BACL|nr:helix-turn-helix transcriptional regulator [Ureibacillus chungkukjangi]MCM3387798.1 helix-turn-helix transcriptional regulator [Ureibacillus chungkukjangi]PYF01771.1 helix-turn-helix protein [Ureibacillus chungkukjangi]
MKMGSLIKYYRTKLGMTQNSVAMGICSIPHLSKIENNNKEANSETIRLLLERLNINIQDVENSEQNIMRLLNDLQKQINYLENERVKETLDKLKEYEEIICFTESIYLYELYKLRYYVFVNEHKLAENQLRWLNAHRKNFSQHERYLHSYYYALVLITKGKYEEAATELNKILQIHPELGSLEGEFYYHFALIKGRLEEPSQAIIYGKKALQFYKDQFNFKRIVYTLISLALNYSRGKVFHEAIEIYEHLLRNVELLQQHQLLPAVYHNLGDLYQMKGEYENALIHFEKSASLMSKDSDHYLLCLYNLGITQFRVEQVEKSINTFSVLKAEAKLKKKLSFNLFATFYLYLVGEEKKKAMDFLEGRLIPYTANNEELKEMHQQFSYLLGEYYRQEKMFEKAMQFI